MTSSVALSWMDEWCGRDGWKSGLEEMTSLPNGSLGLWIRNCILDLNPDNDMGFIRNLRLTWRTLPLARKAALLVIVGFNISLAIVGAHFTRTFARMTKAGRPWSKLVLSQMSLQLWGDNVIGVLGFLALFVVWMDFRYTNWTCLESMATGVQVTLAAIAHTAYLGSVLSSQVLLLLVVADRCQALASPIKYHKHNRNRRCLLANLVAYGFGFSIVTLFEALCRRRNQLADICAPPLWPDAEDIDGNPVTEGWLKEDPAQSRHETAVTITTLLECLVVISGGIIFTFIYARVQEKHQEDGVAETEMGANAALPAAAVQVGQLVLGSYPVFTITGRTFSRTLAEHQPYTWFAIKQAGWILAFNYACIATIPLLFLCPLVLGFI